MDYKFSKDIQNYLEKNPAYQDYLKKNRGEHKFVRCEFPQLMGWNTLRRPEWLPRSLKYPYISKPYGIQARTQERLIKPHINRVKFYRDSDDSHSMLKKAEIHLDTKTCEKRPWGEIRVGTWKKNNNVKVLIKIFDKSKPEWETEDYLISLETCKSQSIGHVNFVHYYGSLETKLLKYHIFEHMSRGNLLQVLRAEMGVVEQLPSHTGSTGTGPQETKDDQIITEDSSAAGGGAGGGRGSGSSSKRFLLTDEILRKMFCQILFAVSHLHDKDMVHRNLKLENILVGEYFDIRIQDLEFLEKTTAQNRGDAQTISRTKYGVEFGPKRYRSPERMKQIGFNPLLDQVWGLGVILYAMFHKKFPFSFHEGDKEQIDRTLQKGTIYPRSSYPPGLLKLFQDLFQPEEFRPRTWELFDYEWLLQLSEPSSVELKRQNAIGRFTHEKAKAILNEKARMLKIRKQLFKRFRLFRADMSRQPNFQLAEILRADGMLDNADRLLGHRPYSPNQLEFNLNTLHDYEKLHKNEYWPSLFQFNPIKCKHLGIRRNYCDIRQDPKDMVGNLLRLQDKRVKQYPVPPNRNDPPKRPPLNLEFVEIDDYLQQK